MKVIKLLLILFLLVLTPFVSAESIQNFDIEIRIIDSKALVSYDISTDMTMIQLTLPADARVTDISEKNYSIKEGRLTSSVSENLKLEYLTEQFIEKTSKSYFTADFRMPADTENLSIRLILPEFAIVENAYPQAEVTSDGRHIILVWKSQLKEKESLPIFVIYKEKKEVSAWFLLALIPLIILIIILKKRNPKIKPKKKEKIKVKEIEIHLLESEAAVIKALKEAKGELWQKQIQLKTGFSKAKLSRVIRNLEARGLVKKIPVGNTNKIKLLIKY